MKTIKWKSIIVGLGATMIATAGFYGTAAGQTVAWAKTTPAFRTEKTAIGRDLNNVKAQQDRVNALKKQCHNERHLKANAVTQTELLKAQADLKRDEGYLFADRNGLLLKHQAVIDERRAELKNDKAMLKQSQQRLNSDLAKGSALAETDVQAVVMDRRAIADDKNKLDLAVTDRNADLMAVNNQLMALYGVSEEGLALENGYAKTQSLAMK